MRDRIIQAMNENSLDIELFFIEYDKRFKDIDFQNFTEILKIYLRQTGIGLDIYRFLMIEYGINKLLDIEGNLLKIY